MAKKSSGPKKKQTITVSPDSSHPSQAMKAHLMKDPKVRAQYHKVLCPGDSIKGVMGKKALTSKIVDSPHDRIQAKKRHPEFQRCLALWRSILQKEQKDEPLTPAEAAVQVHPRSSFSYDAEMEASRYESLSQAEHDRAAMSEEDWLWQEFDPTIDPLPTLDQRSVDEIKTWWASVEKFAILKVPLHHPMTVIERTAGRIVRIYKSRVGLSDAKSSGPPLTAEGFAPRLLGGTLWVRIPLRAPLKAIEPIIRQLVRRHTQAYPVANS